MRVLFWLLVIGFVMTSAGTVWYALRKSAQRRLTEEARMASFLAATAGKARSVDTVPAAKPAPAVAAPAGDGLAQQRLLFEAAQKAGEAGESVLAIQLYARLLARFPATSFAEPARAAVAALKKKLVKA